MTKKQYIQPTVEVCELHVRNLMFSLSQGTGPSTGRTEAPRRGLPIE